MNITKWSANSGIHFTTTLFKEMKNQMKEVSSTAKDAFEISWQEVYVLLDQICFGGRVVDWRKLDEY